MDTLVISEWLDATATNATEEEWDRFLALIPKLNTSGLSKLKHALDNIPPGTSNRIDAIRVINLQSDGQGNNPHRLFGSSSSQEANDLTTNMDWQKMDYQEKRPGF